MTMRLPILQVVWLFYVEYELKKQIPPNLVSIKTMELNGSHYYQDEGRLPVIIGVSPFLV